MSAKSSDSKSDDDIVYYNASLYNPSDVPIPASITDLRSQNVIDYPEDWHMSVIRFDIDSEEIPTTIVPMNSTAPGFQQSKLIITIRESGVSYQANVNVFNYASNPVTGSPPAGSIYSYDEFLTNLNVAAAAAYAAYVLAIGVGHTATVAPYFAMDAQTNIIRCYFQDTYITGNIAPPSPPLEIWVNYLLYRYMVNIPHQISTYNDPTGLDVKILLNSNFTIPISSADRSGFPRDISLTAMPGLVNYTSQETQSVQPWDGISSIFITTRSLPIQSEYLPTNSDPLQNQSFSSQSSPVISDFSINTSNVLEFRQKITYLPSAEYRMVHLAGREGIKRIDAQFWFRAQNGVAYPINIPPNGSCSLKLIFRRAHTHFNILDDKNETSRNPPSEPPMLGSGRRRAIR